MGVIYSGVGALSPTGGGEGVAEYDSEEGEGDGSSDDDDDGGFFGPLDEEASSEPQKNERWRGAWRRRTGLRGIMGAFKRRRRGI